MAPSGLANGGMNGLHSQAPAHIEALNERLMKTKYVAKFHEDELMSDPRTPTGLIPRLRGKLDDFQRVFALQNLPAISRVFAKLLTGGGLDKQGLAQLVSSMATDSKTRAMFMEKQVKDRYERMLHPPVTYLGDAFQYRTADGKFNSATIPHLGQAGSPYAKTVPSKTHSLGALPDAADIFDRLMAREDGGRESKSGLSSMLLYHATIVIHDIFRTNDQDKNISDTSSYLDLSPLYGYTEEMQRKVRDDKYKLGLLKPDTFAEDRLLRQSPGVCIYLVMYNRYHNYAATRLREINENGRFSIPKKFEGTRLAAAARNFVPKTARTADFDKAVEVYEEAWKAALINEKSKEAQTTKDRAHDTLHKIFKPEQDKLDAFYAAYDAAWAKLDDDLFNTARLITCGQFIQISIHDYLKALMGLHQFNTDFTLDPRVNMTEHKNVSRGLGNQVTVEFNLLYRFHCAVSLRDERYIEQYMKEYFEKTEDKAWNPKDMQLPEFMGLMKAAKDRETKKNAGKDKTEPWQQTFGLHNDPDLSFERDPITGLFDDQKMINELNKAMAAPVSNFGPRNVPKSLRPVEVLGIMQARKWGIGTLNDFREFFGIPRHQNFESITPNVDMQNALRDLYENVDKVELYPGVFCECDANLGGDPGPQNATSALWIAIFSDAITLVRSDRFYTVDWNTHNLTSWGMKEVTPDPTVLKGSVFHRLFQRAFPGWYPTDSILFFHPFYTPEANAKYAKAQGYDKDFRMTKTPDGFNTVESLPQKPSKPIYLTDYKKIKAVLSNKSASVIHPAMQHLEILPAKVAEVLDPKKVRAESKSPHTPPTVDHQALMRHATEVMSEMISRNCIAMDRQKGIYQIDVTKDFAIPVVVRSISEFLGIDHLVESEAHPNAKYSENELYRHITNCQMYLSYNSDETKLLKRRKAFQTSMTFLYNLTRQGNVREASKWQVTRAIEGLWPFGKKRNPMQEHGFRVAQQILSHDGDFGRAAAKMLIIALDSAYNNVLAFNSVLNKFIDELYETAAQGASSQIKSCNWIQLQRMALENTPESLKKIRETVLSAQRDSVRLPIIRIATKDQHIGEDAGKFHVKKNQIIICDPYAAADEAELSSADFRDIAYPSSFTSHLNIYHPEEIAILGLTGMIKVLAQLKNLRRGHDKQGMLKKITLGPTYEGYSDFMAPMRVEQIQSEVEHGKSKANSKIFSPEILKPKLDIYLTPEWDEIVPFPTTWKVRFEGFGVSDYAADNYRLLTPPALPDSFPPFYQPQGPSATGGSFNNATCSHTSDADVSSAYVPVQGATAGCAIAKAS